MAYGRWVFVVIVIVVVVVVPLGTVVGYKVFYLQSSTGV